MLQSRIWGIERRVFSQPGMATGPAFAFNVASVVGGPLTISAAWLEGAADDGLVLEVTRNMEHALKTIGLEDTIALGLPHWVFLTGFIKVTR
jgi:hypothetical protein